jgi:predicted acetyltransferase
MIVSKITTTQDREILAHLLQAYEAEFSAITQKLPNGNGVFPPDTHIDENHEGYLVFNQERIPVGFCIKGMMGSIHDVSEFYVIPAMRRQGVGLFLARSVFEMHPGAWQVRQIFGADKARQFWITTLQHYTYGRFSERVAQDPFWGKVYLQEFLVRKAR